MNGASMGMLRVKTDGNTPWTRSGNYGDVWNTASDIPIGSSSFYFEGERGSSWTGDAAVDDDCALCRPSPPSPPPLLPPPRQKRRHSAGTPPLRLRLRRRLRRRRRLIRRVGCTAEIRGVALTC